MNGSSYTITEYRGFGLTLEGSMPVDAMENIAARAAKLAETTAKNMVLHTHLARRLRVGFVFTSNKAAKEWLKELDQQPVKRTTGLDWLDWWIDRGEVGLSSATIAVHCYGERFRLTMRQLGMQSSDARLPLDAGDFGRCRKLVELAAANGEDLLPQLATAPGWGPIVERWTDLCAADGSACADLLKALRTPQDGRRG
jgi:hypothetical protein